MALRAVRNRPGTTARRWGYVIAVLVNAGMLLVVNTWPGWEAVPFLTDEARVAVGLVNLSILVNLAANLVYLADDRSWLKALGDLATIGVGVAALVRIWQVFPFDFSTFYWALVARSLLVLGIIGSIIGIFAPCISFARGLTTAASDREI